MIFEVGKCYKHNSGKLMKIISEIDTMMYGKGLCAETDKGDLQPVGIGEDYAVNWHEIPESEWIDFWKKDGDKCEKKTLTAST